MVSLRFSPCQGFQKQAARARSTAESSAPLARPPDFFMPPIAPHWQQLITQAQSLLTRFEALLPHALQAPDWQASTAFRFKNRLGSHCLEPVKQVARIQLNALVEVDAQKERVLKNTAHFVAGRPANNVLLNGEVHPGEGVEEKISLSERFGLWVSFYPFDQNEYLAVVAQWLRSWGCTEAVIELARQESLVWALQRGSRSGRVAFQFAKDFQARQMT
jgi:predicted AAA+ superfamily ATPase